MRGLSRQIGPGRRNLAGTPRLPWATGRESQKGEKYMSRIKMVLIASVAALAMSVVGASAASAGSGTADLGSGPCNISFTSSGSPTDPTPNSITINNVNEDTSDPDCQADIKNPQTSIDVDFDGNGNLEANGLIRVSALGGLVTCNYAVNGLMGTNTLTTASISGTLTSGGFLCPSPVTGTINVTSF